MWVTSQVRGERPPQTTIVAGMLLPPRPRALTTLLGPVGALLLTLLLMLCAIPVIATAQRPQEIPQKPTWRVINDAPYRVVPAYSPLKETGETLEELGFESVDALLSGIEMSSPGGCVALSRDGLLPTCLGCGTVKLWEGPTGTLRTTLWHAGIVSSVAFSPDGHLLATGSGDGTVALWEVQAQTLETSLEGHASQVLSVAFSPDGRLLATGAWNRTVKLWEAVTGTLKATLEGHTSDVPGRTLLIAVGAHVGAVSYVAFNPDGRLLATRSKDRTVKLWEAATGRLLATLEGHANDVWSVAFSADGRLLATGSRDGTVKLWDVQDKGELQTLLGGNGGNWIGVDRHQRVFRGDDGTLLKRRATQQDNWQPVPGTDANGQETFSGAVSPESLTIEPGQSPEVRVQVKNTSTAPAYWLHLQPATSDDRAIRLIPPNRPFTGEGRQAEKHARIARLDPGEVAPLDARIVVNMKVPAEFLKSSERVLELTVISASGTEVKHTIKVNVQSPWLTWQTAQLDANAKTLKIGL